MSKISGLPMTVTVQDSGAVARDLSNDLSDISVSTPRGMQDITGLDKSAVERLLLLADGKVVLKGTFNAAANKSHDVFKTIPSTSVNRAVVMTFPPTGTGAPQLTMNMVLSDYQVVRAANGSLTWTVQCDLADGAVPTWATAP